MTITLWGYRFRLLALLADEMLLYGFGTSVLSNSQLRMRRNYQRMHNMYDNTAGSGRDLGLNLVAGDILSQRAKFYFHAYFMDKLYSGHSPFVDEGPLQLCKPWFDVLNVEDKTEDYRLTGVRDQQHFQAVKIRLTLKNLAYVCLLSLLVPHVFHRLVYYTQDSWIFFYGENAYREEYDPDYRRRVSRVLLYWITLVLKPQNREASKRNRQAMPRQIPARTAV